MAAKQRPNISLQMKWHAVLLLFCLIYVQIDCSSADVTSLNSSFVVPSSCEANLECSKLPQVCVECNFNKSCNYGGDTTVNCTVRTLVKCMGNRTFEKNITCMFCYQTPKYLHECKGTKLCKAPVTPQQKMIVNCTVKENVYCMGTRKFRKSLPCNWSSGCRWSTAMLLSITLGGFGGDRFYLGHWKEGFGKVFSFGGLGVWTLVDMVLIAVGYVGPADGSLYIF